MNHLVKQKIGIYFGSSTGNTENVAVLIKSNLPHCDVDIIDTAYPDYPSINKYDKIIFGVPTWGIGDLQEDFEAFLNHVKEAAPYNKPIAIYGLGDQNTYTDSFADALATVYQEVVDMGFTVYGKWSSKGYKFEASKAEENGKFPGLVIDEDVQPDKTKNRVKEWTEQLIKEWKLNHDEC